MEGFVAGMHASKRLNTARRNFSYVTLAAGHALVSFDLSMT